MLTYVRGQNRGRVHYSIVHNDGDYTAQMSADKTCWEVFIRRKVFGRSHDTMIRYQTAVELSKKIKAFADFPFFLQQEAEHV